jgi:hypothetical protein
VGYHIPQIIMPMHYANAKAWSELLTFQRTWPAYKFYNECLGEPFDLAAKLVTQTQLQAAAKGGPLDHHAALRKRSKYRGLVMGVDWGGGGVDEVSFTSICIAGIRRDGRVEVIWGKRLLTPYDHIGEAKEVLFWWNFFKPSLLVHDNTGAGTLRETILRQAGLPESMLMPCNYTGPNRQDIVSVCASTENRHRVVYNVDKSRALQLVCGMIQILGVTFFNWDKKSEEEPGLISDFLALIERKSATMGAGELYRIGKMPGRTDDFAQATMLACMGLFYKYKMWPDLVAMGITKITPEQMKAFEGDGCWTG